MNGWHQGQLVVAELESFPLRWYGIKGFKMILQQIDFDNIIISADYKHNNYPANATEIITFEATARK